MGARKGRCCRRSGRSNKIFDMFFGVADYGSVPNQGAGGNIDIEVGRNPTAQSKCIPTKKGQAATRRVALHNDGC
jgi:hypothetical protein